MMKCSVCGENMQTLDRREESKLTLVICSSQEACTRYQVFDPKSEIFTGHDSVKFHPVRENS